MKGADQCPKCGCRKTADMPQAVTSFYAPIVRVCKNCATTWEPFDKSDLLDEGARYSSFRRPCNNCAFRKDSPEHQDPVVWQGLMDKLGWWDGQFFCHKGVPIEPGKDDGFNYPTGADGKHVVKKLRLCRGYLNWLNSIAARAKLNAQLIAAGKEPMMDDRP